MLILETIRVSLGALRANKMRSMLTMLGIVIGIASVISMVALGNGAQNSVHERMAKLGTTLLTINAQRIQQGGVVSTSLAKLTLQDVEAIRDRSPHVTDVCPQMGGTMQLTWKNRNTSVDPVGTYACFLPVRNFQIEFGRMWTESDEHARRKVVVLGGSVAGLINVSDAETLVGDYVRIAGVRFQVVGIVKEKGEGFANSDWNAWMPLTSSRAVLGNSPIFGGDRLQSINALASSEEDIPEAMAEIQSAMRRQHKLRPGQPDDFNIRTQADLLTALAESSATFTLLLAGIAAVSLLVGGIGIMNIMLVSVTERTREIGVRKAIGASRTNILLQFLIEAVVLCVIGGAIGVGVGLVAADQFHRIMGWSTQVQLSSILLAFGFASATGLVFGVWPARRAAVMDPIEALRYE